MLKSFAVAFSMYSKIPMPRVEWSEKNLRYALCFFPLVGAAIGAAVFGWMFFCSVRSANPILQTSMLLALPLLITGGIHADGFLDTSDALASYKSSEEKLRILKDPHVGSFAIIKFLALCLAYMAFASTFTFDRTFYSWCFTFPLCRVLSAFAAANFKCAKNDGTLYAFSNSSAKRTTNAFLALECILCAAAMVFFSPVCGSCIFISALVFFVHFKLMSQKKFGGVTGDLCGWFVCMAETVSTVCAGLVISLGLAC